MHVKLALRARVGVRSDRPHFSDRSEKSEDRYTTGFIRSKI